MQPIAAATRSTPPLADLFAFSTPLGWVAIATQPDCLLRLAFGHRSAAAAKRAIAEPLGAAAADYTPSHAAEVDPQAIAGALERFASGEPTDLSGIPIDVAPLTPFARQVTAACRAIGWGETRSYGELANACGRPAAARAVGSVMAKNRAPLVVPCHRVLGAGGKLGGYSAPEGLAMKRRLLATERHAP
ncbi:MAG: methylated-DNA--[protein]-cysteine S-methyltransferase [Planctomycetota bacterium]